VQMGCVDALGMLVHVHLLASVAATAPDPHPDTSHVCVKLRDQDDASGIRLHAVPSTTTHSPALLELEESSRTSTLHPAAVLLAGTATEHARPAAADIRIAARDVPGRRPQIELTGASPDPNAPSTQAHGFTPQRPRRIPTGRSRRR
jgi:hypothetical protein